MSVFALSVGLIPSVLRRADLGPSAPRREGQPPPLLVTALEAEDTKELRAGNEKSVSSSALTIARVRKLYYLCGVEKTL